jgi:hypothetical protein
MLGVAVMDLRLGRVLVGKVTAAFTLDAILN